MPEKKLKTPTGELINALDNSKYSYSKKDNMAKIAQINELSRRKIKSPTAIIKYHEALCFMQAYPGNAAISRIVDFQLSEFYKIVGDFRESNGSGDDRINDTGMVDTIIRYPYSFNMALWLSENFGSDIDIDWDDYSEKEDDPISGLLSAFAIYVENDGIDDEDISSQDWIENARGKKQSSLAWLLRRIVSANIPGSLKQHLYDNAEIGLKWNLGLSDSSRTLAKKPVKRAFFQRSGLKKSRINLRNAGRKTRPEIKLLSKTAGRAVINRLIKALLPRHRELYPVLFANPHEVYETSPGRGLKIFIPGMRPENRMPLETNYSAILVKNGVPIGYGIAVLFFDQCEIAINVFDTFRSGEASVIFDHFFRVFYHNFGARAFIMRKWQVGHENEEGLQSGSFWFYHKLGFRPIEQETARLAESEHKKIQRKKAYRTDLKTLKKLALSDMVIDLRPGPRNPFEELRVSDIGMAVTKTVAEDFDGDGKRAEKSLALKARKNLGNPDIGGWNYNEKSQFRRWSPLIGIIPDLADWKRSEKSALLALIRSKGTLQEGKFVKLLQAHNHLKVAIKKIARSAANRI
ncbi:MAG: hypothetical protein V3W18_02450 [candidate division Zixibacteria bacterium]